MDWLKYFTQLPAALLLILGICLIAGVLLLGEDPPEVLAFVVVLLVSLVMAAWLYILDKRRDAEEKRRREAESAAQELRQLIERLVGKGGEQRDFWTRPMLQQPLDQTVIDEVFQVFDAALREASQSLREVIPDADPKNVRANVFLPTTDGARRGDVCNLIIPHYEPGARQGLQRNMGTGHEPTIRFRPNEAATGRVFVERRAIGVLTHPRWLDANDESQRKQIERWIYVRLHPEADLSKPGDSLCTEEGKSAFDMTDFQNRQVAERLAWIISMPIFLMIDDALEVVGVFNVDCLEYQLKPEQLRAIYYRVSPFAGVLAGVVRGLPTDRVAIVRFMG